MNIYDYMRLSELMKERELLVQAIEDNKNDSMLVKELRVKANVVLSIIHRRHTALSQFVNSLRTH